MDILRKRVLVVGNDLQPLLDPIRSLGYETLFTERADHVLSLAAAYHPAIALISQTDCMRNPELPAVLDRLLKSIAVSVLASSSVPGFLEDSSSSLEQGHANR